jgi:hypothetical protein
MLNELRQLMTLPDYIASNIRKIPGVGRCITPAGDHAHKTFIFLRRRFGRNIASIFKAEDVLSKKQGSLLPAYSLPSQAIMYSQRCFRQNMLHLVFIMDGGEIEHAFFVESEVLTAVTIFCNVTPCSPNIT